MRRCGAQFRAALYTPGGGGAGGFDAACPPASLDAGVSSDGGTWRPVDADAALVVRPLATQGVYVEVSVVCVLRSKMLAARGGGGSIAPKDLLRFAAGWALVECGGATGKWAKSSLPLMGGLPWAPKPIERASVKRLFGSKKAPEATLALIVCAGDGGAAGSGKLRIPTGTGLPTGIVLHSDTVRTAVCVRVGVPLRSVCVCV